MFANAVAAINNLYVALGSPVLPGWVASGGDPCGELWQGILCNNSDIKSMYGDILLSLGISILFQCLKREKSFSVLCGSILNGANLGGELGDNLSMFASIKAM